MKLGNVAWCGLTIAISGALISPGATAQPATDETKRPVTLPLTLAELEQLIGGRTTLTLNLKDATLEEAAAAINQSSGLQLKVRPKPVFKRPPGMENMPMPDSPEPRYSFEATGKPFWEEFLAWQRAALAAKKVEAPQPDIVLPDGRSIPRRVSTDLKLFRMQNFNNVMQLQPGNPLSEGRTLVSWPYVMVGTRLTRTQAATLDETGLRRLEDTDLGRKPPRMGAAPAAPAVPAPPKQPPTEAERWIDGLILNAQTHLDPKIKASNLRCEVEEAMDDKGNDLRPSNEEAAVLLNGIGGSYSDGSGGATLNIPIRSRQDMGKKLVRLRGTLRFSVVTKNQHWETTDLETPTAANIWRDGNEFTVQFKGLTKTANGWEVGFDAEGRGQRLRQLWDQWFSGFGERGGIFGGSDFQVQLVDDKGETLVSSGGVTRASLGGDNKPSKPVSPGDSPLPADITNQVYTEFARRNFGQAFMLNGNMFGGNAAAMGRPAKLIVDLPIERREVVVPFEFTNLPLPPS